MVVLVVLAGGLFHGDADDASVFGVFLLGGALLGAAGGALAVSGQAPRPLVLLSEPEHRASRAPSGPGRASRCASEISFWISRTCSCRLLLLDGIMCATLHRPGV